MTGFVLLPWGCERTSCGLVVSAWEFLMREVGRAKQQKRVSPSIQDVRSQQFIVFSLYVVWVGDPVCHEATTTSD